MIEQEEPGRDLAGLVVPLAGRLVATGDRWEPYRSPSRTPPSPPGSASLPNPSTAAPSAEFRACRAADQQARVNAPLLEAVAALASLLGTPGPHPSPAAPSHVTSPPTPART